MSSSHREVEYDLEFGEGIVLITEGHPSIIRLMDDANFEHYKRGEQFTYYGPGRAVSTPKVEVFAPRAGHWHVVIDQEEVERDGPNGSGEPVVNSDATKSRRTPDRPSLAR